jgi:cation transport protein ChaC
MPQSPHKLKKMRLTLDHIAHVERVEPDPGVAPGLREPTEQEYSALVTDLLREHDPQNIWIFAYGSLIWNPGFDVVEELPATAMGWHRSYCMTINRCRGLPEFPSLMLALDRGGSCKGIALRLGSKEHLAQLRSLMRREIDSIPTTYIPRWITVQTKKGALKALTFVIDPKGSAYAGRLPIDKVANTLAMAAGHLGSSAAYLHRTVSKLEEHGIRDSNLWKIQQLVAEKIEGSQQKSKF